ncbi:MAG: hypothetical protein LBH92_09015 [Bacteroidales bacterium]|nr:hypothetical protein [Bacteroidales bacterium]
MDSIEYDFLFNTGSKEFLTLPQREKEDDLSETSPREKENAEMIIDTLITQQTDVATIGDLDPITGVVRYSKGVRQPIVGRDFISRFDWIIDRNKGKIYVKRIEKIDKLIQ